MFAMATTVAADCPITSWTDVTTTAVTNTANNKNGIRFGLFPCMRNHLERPSVAQSLDGIGRLAGSLHVPVASRVSRLGLRRKHHARLFYLAFIFSLYGAAGTRVTSSAYEPF